MRKFINYNQSLEILNSLNITKTSTQKLFVSDTLNRVLASDIIQSKLTFSTGDSYSHEILQEQYFIKSDNNLAPFRYSSDLLASGEFLESIKSKIYEINRRIFLIIRIIKPILIESNFVIILKLDSVG